MKNYQKDTSMEDFALEKKKKYLDFYMAITQQVSQMSQAKRLKVGSILVKDGNIISFGWNGMPSGWDNNCEDKVYANEWSVDNNRWDYQEEDSGIQIGRAHV